MISQNGLWTVPVWKDWYIFTGGSNGSGWLLSRKAGMVNRFMGGLVLPAKDPIFTVNVKLDSFEPQAGSEPGKDWIACAQDNKVYFEGNQYSHDPVIILSERESKGIIGTLREQVHFHPKIYEAANEHNPHEICLRAPEQTKEDYNAVLQNEWSEEDCIAQRIGTSFKWSEINRPHRTTRTATTIVAAPASKHRKTTTKRPVALVAAETVPSSTPSAASTPDPTEPTTAAMQPPTATAKQAVTKPKQSERTVTRRTKDAATMTDSEQWINQIEATRIPTPEIQPLETVQSLPTLQSFYNLARLEAIRSFPTLMTAASRLEALSASCTSSKKSPDVPTSTQRAQNDGLADCSSVRPNHPS
ncbi:hypothetical protein N7449_008039 [Penicillium cf. viridicatum]|uniref:Uncharacterized protein n=1 Tax=Penicillium cf. viridicatum TaxID=2972119 RepID=A0A9W9MCM2_9EURO|nr:hypothetical protein N7449_008039 [Penicillium cf. viridicatum]